MSSVHFITIQSGKLLMNIVERSEKSLILKYLKETY
jgi:hypothetical protein